MRPFPIQVSSQTSSIPTSTPPPSMKNPYLLHQVGNTQHPTTPRRGDGEVTSPHDANETAGNEEDKNNRNEVVDGKNDAVESVDEGSKNPPPEEIEIP